QINELLSKYSNLSTDGRPSIGMSCGEMVESLKEISKDIEIFAAHAWTPWFGVFGSKSGFDSLKEAYEGKEKEILAIETGLSSDLEMNFCVSALDNYTLISNSDAHSLEKIGREANIIEAREKSYKEIVKAIKEKKVSTIEYYPQEGKYYYDGHRNCGVSFSPEETKRFNGICPVCRKPLTIGVLHRVFELGDREFGYIPKNAQKSIHLIPLIEIISKVTKKEIYSKEVQEEYNKLTQRFKEIDILTKVKEEEIMEINEKLGIAIKNVREGKIKIKPGYDGVYGKIEIEGFETSFKLKPKLNKQQPLF
ncbi:MAG: endonuclease Q family protein, partial [Candidatus Micrarchaeia archaeon]